MIKRKTRNTSDSLSVPSRQKTDHIDKGPTKLKQLFFNALTDANDDDENGENEQPPKCKKRILNGEIGGNVVEMRPLMSMDKEMCPLSAEEEDERVEQLKAQRSELVNNKAVIVFRKPASPMPHKDNSNAGNANRTQPDASQCQRSRHIVRQTTYYDTWYVIRPKIWPSETRQQRHYLELPLVKLANAAKHMKLPSANWNSKVTLYKVAPAVLQRHTLTIFTGDLKVHKIPERERQKYQPSCVIFRRELPLQERNKSHVPYDRVIIFKHKHFTVNFDGKLVNLCGAPEAVTCLMDVQKLLDILESITLANSMIEIVTPK